MPVPTLSQVWFWVFTVICAGGGAYIGSYLKKKGENVATHEDFERVLVEVKTTTKATKAIEERISDEFWNKQRRWELKRDILVEAVRKLSAFNFALQDFNQASEAFVQVGMTPDWNEQKTIYNAYRQAQLTVRESFLLMSVNCVSSTIAAYKDTAAMIELIGESAREGKPILDGQRQRLAKLWTELAAAVRRELGVEEWV